MNNKLIAVEGCQVLDHGGAGRLKSIMGNSSIEVENKPIIVAIGDTVEDSDGNGHSPGQSDPLGRSSDVIAYESGAGGTVT